MTLSVINDLKTLRLHKRHISELFLAAFGRPLDIDEWEWLFADNPNGPALVALWHDGARLTGHTAFVPFTFIDGDSRLRAYRSGTTMIDPACETPGLMALLVKELQRRARTEGAPVFGFPNDNSWLGFQRFLKWTIVDGRLAVIPGRTILDRPIDFVSGDRHGRFALDMSNRDQIEWRLNRPATRYCVRDGLITSQYRGVEQLIHLTEAGLRFIDPYGTYRVLDLNRVSSNSTDGHRYRFGYWSSPDHPAIAFSRPELLWSDVF